MATEEKSGRARKATDVRPDELNGWEDQTGELVKLDVGECVTGTLVGHTMVEGDNGSYPIFTFSDEEGMFKVPGTVQIQQALQSADPGDSVYIERLKDGKSNKGRRFQTYKVMVKRA